MSRFSAYDFEKMMGKNATITVSDQYAEITKPVDELKESIQGIYKNFMYVVRQIYP